MFLVWGDGLGAALTAPALREALAATGALRLQVNLDDEHVADALRFGTGELVSDPACQPALDVERTVIQQTLRCLGKRGKFMQRNGNPLNARCVGFRDRTALCGPACTHFRVIDQHVIGRRINIHDTGDRPDRRG